MIYFTLLWSFIGYNAETCKPAFTTFHTKTSYDHIGNKDLHVSKPGNSCVPIQINAVHRHGHRYPSASNIRGLKVLAKKLTVKADYLKSKFNITFPLAEALRDFYEAENKLLTSIGEDDSYHIAKRIKTRFPEVFHPSYSPLSYKFRSTCKSRCVRTANSLAYGFFENRGHLGKYKFQPVSIETRDCSHDVVLRPWDACEEWIDDVLTHKGLKEYYRFIAGKEIKSVKDRINERIGLNGSQALSLNDIKRLFEACAYHINMYKGELNNGICKLLKKDDISVIEYLYELDYFYAYSAGHKLSYRMACPLLSDIYRTLEDARNSKNGAYAGIFRVGHQETLVPLLTLMGVYVKRGERLRASNYEDMRNRTFRSACMAPYSGNVYFTLFKCADNEFKIQMFVNEHLVRIPCCESASHCDVDVFLKCYKNSVEKCNFKKMCDD